MSKDIVQVGPLFWGCINTAHGFLAWAFATLISATALVPATACLANGVAAGFSGASAQAARAINPAEIYVDKLFRTAPSAQASTPSPTSQTDNANHGNAQRSEVLRLWSVDLRCPFRKIHPAIDSCRRGESGHHPM